MSTAMLTVSSDSPLINTNFIFTSAYSSTNARLSYVLHMILLTSFPVEYQSAVQELPVHPMHKLVHTTPYSSFRKY